MSRKQPLDRLRSLIDTLPAELNLSSQASEKIRQLRSVLKEAQERESALIEAEKYARNEAQATRTELTKTRAETEKALKALAESEQRYRYMGETIPFGVWWCNPKGEAEYVSPSFCELLNMTLEEQRKFGWTKRLVPEDVEPMMTKWMHCCETGTPWDHEHRIIDRHGKIHTVLSRGLPVRNEDGTIIAWVGVNLDITARKQIELQLQEAKNALEQALHVKDQILANISHELRTPLTLILGPVQKLQQAENLTPKQRQDLEVVERNARTLLKNVNNLLDLSKLDAGRIQLEYAEVDLARLARFVVSHFESVAAEKQISLVVDTPASLSGQVDGERLQRVLFNLLSNALKFTPVQGRVTFRLLDQQDRAVFVVEDTGPGIPEDMRDAIFERFRQIDSSSTRRYAGTGLGLAIVREFVNLHHGSVAVTEADGGGARFQVFIPRVAPAGTEIKPAMPALDKESALGEVVELRTQVGLPAHHEIPVAPDAPLVLVVEDNPEMNAFITESLSDVYKIITTFDGQEGLKRAVQHRPDLIVSDIMMPQMSGEELVTELRKMREMDDIPVLLLTAKADPDLRIKLLSTGAQDCLVKPFITEELLARAGTLIERKRRNEAQLRESEERFRAFMNNTPTIAWAKDEEGRHVYLNHAYEQRFGVKLEDWRGKTDFELWPKEVATVFRQNDLAVLKSDNVHEIVEETQDSKGNRNSWLNIKFPFQDASGKRYIGGVGIDITDRIRMERELRALNETLENRVAERTAELEQRTQQLQVLARQLTKAEQQERQRVAYILHEQFQQLIAGAKFTLSTIKNKAPDSGEAIVDNVNEILDKAIEESRSLAIELSPPILRHARFPRVLQWLGSLMHTTHGLDVQVHADEGVEVKDPHLRELLFQAVRELLSNVAKHAGVNQAFVEIKKVQDSKVEITVSDQGNGFDVQWYRSEISQGKKLGLFGIEERLALLGGNVDIFSSPGHGSRIILMVPAQ